MTLPCALDGRLRISAQITFSFAQNPFVSQCIRTRANLYDGVDWQLWCNELAVVDYMWVAFVCRLQQKLDLESFLASCPWMAANSYDWIYMTPAIVVLFVNILFLVKIMWVSRHLLYFFLDFSGPLKLTTPTSGERWIRVPWQKEKNRKINAERCQFAKWNKVTRHWIANLRIDTPTRKGN